MLILVQTQQGRSDNTGRCIEGCVAMVAALVRTDHGHRGTSMMVWSNRWSFRFLLTLVLFGEL